MIHKKMILSILIIAFVGLGAAATWAEWTGEAAGTSNSVGAAPTMHLDVYDAVQGKWVDDSGVSKISINDAFPGDSHRDVGTISVADNSPVPVTIDSITCSASEADGKDMYKYLKIYANGLQIYDGATDSRIAVTTSLPLLANMGSQQDIKITYDLDLNAPDTVKSAVFDFDVVFTATQNAGR